MVKERHRKSHFECGVLESTNLEYLSDAQPRPKAEFSWVSIDLESKTDQLQSQLRAEQESHISVAFR
ncbi:hypothetical protein FRX31_009215 [Thalictrum thalictroides]|uniref:Uncharacterized protein n=1 Tax=Thalictrum thalictroides TaxID=46969 RepID=A0A7J6WWA6_THATH|nr:hypothetical protein FRX31_009215 [Thalictrum thalictroides]